MTTSSSRFGSGNHPHQWTGNQSQHQQQSTPSPSLGNASATSHSKQRAPKQQNHQTISHPPAQTKGAAHAGQPQSLPQATNVAYKGARGGHASTSSSSALPGKLPRVKSQQNQGMPVRGHAAPSVQAITNSLHNSSISQTATIAPIASGARPSGFIRSWYNASKERDHFNKHVVLNNEFTHTSANAYSTEAYQFWEKPISVGQHGPNLLEKTGKNGSLYRFEPATGILGVAKIDARTKSPVQISYFKPKLFAGAQQPNQNFLRDALAYYNRQ